MTMDARTDYDEPDTVELSKLVLRTMIGVNAQSFRRWGNKVLMGPFTGMIIPERTPWADGNASTKLLGTYEHELHSTIEYAAWRQPKVGINVGCAEGYYAIGLARIGLPMIALDTSEDSRVLCEDYAERNEVSDKVTLIDGARAPEELRFEALKGHRLYIIDCEGDEDTLIDLDRCPEMVNSDLIVECHDFLKPGVSSRIADRLYATHRIELIRPRLPDLRFLERIPSALGVLTAVEKRPLPCYWLACWANAKGDSHG